MKAKGCTYYISTNPIPTLEASLSMIFFKNKSSIANTGVEYMVAFSKWKDSLVAGI